MTPQWTDQATDADLWSHVLRDDAAAFEVLVRRHQSIVAAVAYNACGDLALSEDVAQDTFWTAWHERQALNDPARLRSWLAGIARNLGRNARRHAARSAAPADLLDPATEPSAGDPGPLESAALREEESLVWQTLEEIPETYREPLILFYREGESVAEVAAALELSVEATRQRLSRGRDLLRERVAGLVEGVLRRSRPGRRLTLAVMTGLTATTAGAKTAFAGTAVTATPLAGPLAAGVSSGVVGSLLGPLIGLAGGWVGTRVPAELAPTRGQRDVIRRSGWRMFAASLVFTALIGGMVWLRVQFPKQITFVHYLIAWAIIMASFWAFLALESVRSARARRRLREQPGDDVPNDSPLRQRVAALATRWRGRVYRSRRSLLGWPLVDINVSDPALPGTVPDEQRVARGWIAVGDRATGILLAVGGTARGLIAFGGRTLGIVSCGGVAAGVLAFGGLAVGVVPVGGFAAGVVAIGGGAVGWQAVGGGAVGWDLAVGGGAVAWDTAYGGAAIARERAVGGEVVARAANQPGDREALETHPYVAGMKWYAAHAVVANVVLVVVALAISAAGMNLWYRREPAS